MKSLPLLKRISAYQLDESKRRLGALNQRMQEAEDRLKALLKSHQHQQDVKRDYEQYAPQLDGNVYGNYVQAVEEKRRAIIKLMGEINRDIFVESEEMMKHFQESKKLDIIDDGIKARELAEEEKKTEAFLDELGRFRTRKT